jgi:glycosyltransferase involved in cell wall biosynthesis
MSKPITLTFVSSAFNEAANLEELHQRCRAAHAKLQQEFWKREEIQFSFVVADNGSRDGSLGVLEELCNRDPAVVALANQGNYGPEPSAANALEQVRMSDLVVILCSDLQDPPELAVAMARTLLEQQGVDAVLAVKKRSAGGPLVRMARRLYYTVLGYSSRLRSVPNGFHGFGCYRQSVVEDALRFWRGSDLNLRQCLANACRKLNA